MFLSFYLSWTILLDFSAKLIVNNIYSQITTFIESLTGLPGAADFEKMKKSN
jgi:hypothetical protein